MNSPPESKMQEIRTFGNTSAAASSWNTVLEDCTPACGILTENLGKIVKQYPKLKCRIHHIF